MTDHEILRTFDKLSLKHNLANYSSNPQDYHSLVDWLIDEFENSITNLCVGPGLYQKRYNPDATVDCISKIAQAYGLSLTSKQAEQELMELFNKHIVYLVRHHRISEEQIRGIQKWKNRMKKIRDKEMQEAKKLRNETEENRSKYNSF